MPREVFRDDVLRLATESGGEAFVDIYERINVGS